MTISNKVLSTRRLADPGPSAAGSRTAPPPPLRPLPPTFTPHPAPAAPAPTAGRRRRRRGKARVAGLPAVQSVACPADPLPAPPAPTPPTPAPAQPGPHSPSRPRAGSPRTHSSTCHQHKNRMAPGGRRPAAGTTTPGGKQPAHGDASRAPGTKAGGGGESGARAPPSCRLAAAIGAILESGRRPFCPLARDPDLKPFQKPSFRRCSSFRGLLISRWEPRL
jgi:hypothetical protein